MENPIVSIIVPVYNVERFLGECLDSVLAQTFADFEVICVNDGSPDRSGEVLSAYAAADSRIRVINQSNRGLSAARNAGIDAARGKYLAFLDSDDLLAPIMLETVIAQAEATGVDITVFDYYMLDDTTGELSYHRDQAVYAALDRKTFRLADTPQLMQFIGAWDRIYRRDFIAQNGFRFLEGRLYEDVPFYFETGLAAETMTLVADHLHYYRQSVAASITGNERGSSKHDDDYLFVQQNAQDQLRRAGISHEGWGYYSDYYLEYTYAHQRFAHPYAHFREFFERVRNQAVSLLSTCNRGNDTPQEALYRSCLLRDHPALAWAYMNLNNQARRPLMAWQQKQRRARLMREGMIDDTGKRLQFPERSPQRVQGYSRADMEVARLTER